MKLKAALVFVLAAIGLHIYLALHYYGLTFNLLTEESACNISAAFNCDAVSASQFSALFGIPIAMWGAVTNGILMILLMIWILGWTDDRQRLGKYTLWLSAFVALVSIVMGSISTFFIGTYCLYCMGTYLLSFLTWFAVWKAQELGPRPSGEYLRELIGPAHKYALLIAAIPLITWFFHRSYVSKVGGADLEVTVRASIAEWQAAPFFELKDAVPTLVKGPDSAKMVITEFADFRCGHCKQASSSVKAFLNSRQDVQMRFYTFPLDGTCNPAMPAGGGGDGVSCWLAKSVLCAEKTAGQGWPLHDAIFAKQNDINSNPGLEYARDQVGQVAERLKIPAEAQKTCVESPETDALIRAQAKMGQDVGLRGTPLFLVNGRKLSRGQLLPVLEEAYKASPAK